MWVRYGKAEGLPVWAQALVLAERWGVPPWEIQKARGSVAWAARAGALDEAREKSAKMDRQKK